MEKISDRIKDLIEEKSEEINRHKYHVLTIKIQDGHPVIVKQEITLKPGFDK